MQPTCARFPPGRSPRQEGSSDVLVRIGRVKPAPLLNGEAPGIGAIDYVVGAEGRFGGSHRCYLTSVAGVQERKEALRLTLQSTSKINNAFLFTCCLPQAHCLILKEK
jgi:hypothetical protein